MENKMGVYICSGCGIGESMDLDALSAVAEEFKVGPCRLDPCLCGPEGVSTIRADMDGEGFGGAVIAACSPRVMTDVFTFPPDKLIERVNIREQVAWTQPAGEEDTLMMARDSLRMGIVKVRDSQPPGAFMAEDPSKRILVVGGGLTGMTAAKEAACAGYEVVLVEKEDKLGGWLNVVYRLPPIEPPYENLREFDLNDMATSLAGQPGVTVYTGAAVASVSGGPCMFDVEIGQNGSTKSERVGSIILATGSVPYNASKLQHLSYGSSVDIVTAGDLEAMFKKAEVKRPSNGQPVKSVAFVLCAGSRDPDHLPYCSSACCVESLKQAKYFKETDPQTQVYIFCRDMRSTGFHELLFDQLRKDGVIFVQGDVTAIDDDGSGGFVITADEVLTRSPVMSKSVDLVVLATGMVPTSALGEPFKVQTLQEGEKEPTIPAHMLVSNLLNLKYRQGPSCRQLSMVSPILTTFAFLMNRAAPGSIPPVRFAPPWIMSVRQTTQWVRPSRLFSA